MFEFCLEGFLPTIPFTLAETVLKEQTDLHVDTFCCPINSQTKQLRFDFFNFLSAV